MYGNIDIALKRSITISYPEYGQPAEKALNQHQQSINKSITITAGIGMNLLPKSHDLKIYVYIHFTLHSSIWRLTYKDMGGLTNGICLIEFGLDLGSVL